MHYQKVRKKYARWRSFFYNSSMAVGSLSVIFTSAGVATALTGPGIVVGIPLSAIGGLMTLITASLTVVSKKLTKKISKHEKKSSLLYPKKIALAILSLKH